MKRNEIIRIVGDNPSEPEFVEINKIAEFGKINDITTGKYDTIVTEGFSSPTARKFSFMMLLEMAKIMPPELIPYHMLIDASDYDKKDEWKAFVEQKLGIAQPQMQQGQMTPQGTGAPSADQLPPELVAAMQQQGQPALVS